MLTLGLLFSGGDVHADNTAPTLGNGILASISEDSASPTGQTVSTVFSGQFTDPDAGASLSGIAVVGNTANAGTHGAWQYSTNSGSNWFPIGTVADDATALAISASALIRFVPVANYHGTPPALTVRGLDNTYAGGFSSTGASETRVTVDTSSNGGSTPVAGATSSLSTSVTPVADTPSVTNATTNEDTQTTSGLVISRNAADGTEVTHFRITAITNGTLYQNNGTTTIANNAFITFAQGNAGLKFTPSANFSGTASFTVQASTSNAVGGLGGTTVTATITVNAVNDAPTITDIAHQSTHTNTPTAALAFTVGDVETAAASLVLSGTSANPTLVPNGNIVFGGSGASRTVTVTPAADQTGTTTISVSVSDGTTNTVDTFTLGVTVPAQRVLSGTATIGASATSTNITIAQVHLGRSFLVFSSTVSDGDPGETQVRGQITSPTTIAFNRATSGTAVSISWSVVEYASGVTVQRGTTNSWSTTSTGVTLAGIATNRSVPIITASVPGNIHSEDDFIRARFTSATNLELTRIGSNSAATVDWQVIEFANATVQAGDLSFLAGDASKTATITSVNTNKSWLLYTFRSPDGTIANIGQKMLRGLITSSTNLTFDRSNTGQALDLAWHLVEFTDATTVRHGTEPFGAAELQRDVTIASVNTDKSFAIGGKYGRGGRSTYSGDDNPGVGWMTLELTSSTNLRITRSLTGSTAADMGWYVVQMPNVLPTISSIADLSTDEDTATTALGFTVNDLETAAASLTVSGSSSDQTLVPDANIVFGGSGANRTVTVTPAANQHGSATITVTVGDGTDTATETFVLTVNPVNDAPVLSGANDFTSVMAGDADHAGDLVSALIAGQMSDADSGALAGIAVLGTSAGSGTWQYSTNGGSAWLSIGTVSTNSALLLRSEDRIRLVPGNVAGGTDSITFRAWDRTSGTFGALADATTAGGITAFSSGTASSTIAVTAGAFVKLQLLLPGETAAPGTASGKTGSPTAQTAGSAFSVTVRAVDANWNVVGSVTDVVGFTSSDGSAVLPANGNLVAGLGTFDVTFRTAGGQTATVSDLTDGAKSADTSPAVTVNAASIARLALVTQPGGAGAGAPFGQQPVIETQDAFGNSSTVGLAASLMVSVTLTSGTGPLQGTTALDIGTAAGAGTVSFANLRLDPAGTKQLTFSAAGLTDAVSATFTVDNELPVAGLAEFQRPRNVPIKLLIANLLTNATDLNGDALTLVSVSATSTNGAAIHRNSTFVLYSVPPDGNVTDRFSYTVSDGVGSTVGEVEITVAADPTGTNFNVVACALVAGKPTMTFAGVPGHSYVVQRTQDLTGTPVWTDLWTTNAPAAGLFHFVDDNPPAGDLFYRGVNR